MRLMILALAMIWAMPAAGQQTACAERSKLLNSLRKIYQEAPVAVGVTRDGSLLELAVSHTGSWTIIVTSPNKTSCAIVTGERWMRLKDTLETAARVKGF